MAKRRINIKQFVTEVREGLSDYELAEKYRISVKGVQNLYEKLLEAGKLEPSDLLDKDLTFERTAELAMTCPHCGAMKLFDGDLCIECGMPSTVSPEVVDLPTEADLGDDLGLTEPEPAISNSFHILEDIPSIQEQASEPGVFRDSPQDDSRAALHDYDRPLDEPRPPDDDFDLSVDDLSAELDGPEDEAVDEYFAASGSEPAVAAEAAFTTEDDYTGTLDEFARGLDEPVDAVEFEYREAAQGIPQGQETRTGEHAEIPVGEPGDDSDDITVTLGDLAMEMGEPETEVRSPSTSVPMSAQSPEEAVEDFTVTLDQLAKELGERAASKAHSQDQPLISRRQPPPPVAATAIGESSFTATPPRATASGEPEVPVGEGREPMIRLKEPDTRKISEPKDLEVDSGAHEDFVLEDLSEAAKPASRPSSRARFIALAAAVSLVVAGLATVAGHFTGLISLPWIAQQPPAVEDKPLPAPPVAHRKKTPPPGPAVEQPSMAPAQSAQVHAPKTVPPIPPKKVAKAEPPQAASSGPASAVPEAVGAASQAPGTVKQPEPPSQSMGVADDLEESSGPLSGDSPPSERPTSRPQEPSEPDKGAAAGRVTAQPGAEKPIAVKPLAAKPITKEPVPAESPVPRPVVARTVVPPSAEKPPVVPAPVVSKPRPSRPPTHEAGLISAVRERDFSSAKKILDGGSDVNSRDDQGRTALMHAASLGDEKMVMLLLEKGADINLMDNNRSTALQLSLRSGNAAVTRLLLDRAGSEEGVRLLFEAATNGQEEEAQLLLRGGADVNARDEAGNTPLMLASGKCHMGLIKLLLEHGADVNASNKEGFTALSWAYTPDPEADPPLRVRRQVVRLLKSRGARAGIFVGR